MPAIGPADQLVSSTPSHQVGSFFGTAVFQSPTQMKNFPFGGDLKPFGNCFGNFKFRHILFEKLGRWSSRSFPRNGRARIASRPFDREKSHLVTPLRSDRIFFHLSEFFKSFGQSPNFFQADFGVSGFPPSKNNG